MSCGEKQCTAFSPMTSSNTIISMNNFIVNDSRVVEFVLGTTCCAAAVNNVGARESKR